MSQKPTLQKLTLRKMSMLLSICLLPGLVAATAAPATQPPPRVFLLDAKTLAEQKQRIQSGDKDDSLVKAAREAADHALSEGPFSVMQKEQTPPSGNKHDYLSLAPYFWPNPDTPNHLPYIRHDGERNPEIRKIPDHDNIGRMAGDARRLALGYYFTGNDAYAQRAVLLLRTWFLDPATAMRPNLEFAQGIRGVNDGRSTGIIESRALADAVDAVGLLDGSKAWTAADQKGIEQWFTEFLKWLQESANGKGEAAATNNHGTYYDVQAADFALFVGNRTLAEKIIKDSMQKRIAQQIESDGKQPRELGRTRAFSYSIMNLHGLMDLAQLGKPLGIDLWKFQTADGRSIRKAIDFLVPYASGEKKWDYEQITEFSPQEFGPLLLRAAAGYGDPSYAKLADKIGTQGSVDVLLLRKAL